MVIVDEKYEEEYEKCVTFLLTLVGKETTDLGNSNLSRSFFSKKLFHILRHTSNNTCINS